MTKADETGEEASQSNHRRLFMTLSPGGWWSEQVNR